MMQGRSTTRVLASAAIAGQLAFVVSWIVGGALQPGYSHLEQAVSELGAKNAAHPWIVNTGIVVLGLSIAALGPALLRVLPRRAILPAALFVAAGVLVAVPGVFQLDCAMSVQRCEDMWRAGQLSWQHDAHIWLAFAGGILIALTPFGLARALWPSPVGAAALTAGTQGAVLWVATFFLGESDSAGGLVQRVGLGIIHLWVVIVAVGILWAVRRTPEPGKLVPLRPRDFWARSWSGDGELVLRPFWLGRRIARRVAARREAVWLSESVWRFDDEIRFAEGQTLRRHTFCEFVAEDRLRLTASDLPDGGEVTLEEGGYRLAPFRMAFPIGPVPVHIRCHDLSHVERDGTFVNVIDARTVGLGIPLARMTFRVRPDEARGDGAQARTEPAPAASG